MGNDSFADSVALTPVCTNMRTSSDPATIARAIVENLCCLKGRTPTHASLNDWYTAVAHTLGDRLLDHWVKTLTTQRRQPRIVSYLSAEFLLGPHLGNAMLSLGIYDQVKEAVTSLGLDLNKLLDHEHEPGLGNGGLGRLAACFLDSLATLKLPAIGYGIRYEFGIFDQVINDGWQKELTDKWLAMGNPWEIARPEVAYQVGFGGYTEYYDDENGDQRVRWVPRRIVKSMAFDTPIPGYHGPVVDLLRLWKAEPTESLDFQAFNGGDYYRAVQEKIISETITKVLYPNDEPDVGKQLRLAQQYFFVSCSLHDMIRIHELQKNSVTTLHDGFAVQLNDTHPSIAIAELMRILVDERHVAWDEAWSITNKTFSYTNHTLLPEALEKWPLPLFRKMLPRHIEIIFEINRRFLDGVRRTYGRDEEQIRRLSIIDEADDKYVRMANLAVIGSHAVNGVAELHTELLKQTILKDFYKIWPEKFHNITNGVTPRRWVALSNPDLTSLITETIGGNWVSHFEVEISNLERFASDKDFREKWYEVKQANKISLANYIKERTGVAVFAESLFDVQVKRIHEYKRQHLNILHVVTLYRRLKENSSFQGPARTVLFGGKAAPGYFMAKLIIKLINAVADKINNDPDIGNRLKVVFFPDFNVQNGQRIYPAADLSEQISTAGKEASGTGNMKFSMNGAITIGTLDGANMEIREQVGEENFFLFGLDTSGVSALKASGYQPRAYYETNKELRETIDLIGSGFFSNSDSVLFKPLVDNLLERDEYLVLADYQSYIDCQDEIGRVYKNRDQWATMSILNVARMGKFSSDRSIREYVEKIWRIKPLVPVEKD